MKKDLKLKTFQNLLLDEQKNDISTKDKSEWIKELKKHFSWNELEKLLNKPKATLRKWENEGKYNQNESRIRNPYELDKLIQHFKKYKPSEKESAKIRKLIDVLEHLIGLE
jgi:hypothetical protein